MVRQNLYRGQFPRKMAGVDFYPVTGMISERKMPVSSGFAGLRPLFITYLRVFVGIAETLSMCCVYIRIKIPIFYWWSINRICVILNSEIDLLIYRRFPLCPSCPVKNQIK